MQRDAAAAPKRRDQEFLGCSKWDAALLEVREFSVWTELIFPGEGRRICKLCKDLKNLKSRNQVI